MVTVDVNDLPEWATLLLVALNAIQVASLAWLTYRVRKNGNGK